LILGKEPAVGQTGPDILQVDDALHFGLEGLANLVQQVGQGSAIGSLLIAAPEERISDSALR
jgi:hypothetical protein